MRYKKRTNKPTNTLKWYGNNNPFSGGAYDMFKNNGNCTHYCYSRMSEILGKKSNLPSSNAGGWLKKVSGYKTGLTPKLGAVAIWKRKGTLTNQGHVATVENIKSNRDIETTNSGWKSSLFYTKIYYKKDNYDFTSNSGHRYIFQGFIYCGLEFEEEKSVETKFNLTRLLKKGVSGNDVKELQKELNKNGWRDAKLRVLVVDGIFGNNTLVALKKLQSKRGLVVDGIVGQATARSLGWTYKGK